MNSKFRLALSFLGAGVMALPGRSESVPSRQAPATPAPAAATPTEASRFSSFDGASSAVLSAVANAQAIATQIRNGPVASSIPQAGLAQAVAQASAAIVQDGRIARSNLLAERQAALTRLRLAATEADRLRLISELRGQLGQRMEEQREVARLVRDRLRELRATTTITRPAGN